MLALLATFAFVSLASRQLGKGAARWGLPLISGYLLAGMLAGPYILGLFPEGTGLRLRVVDEVALGFIAFAAGAELFLKELKGHGRSISFVTAGQIITTFVLGAGTLFLLSDFVPFMQSLRPIQVLAMSLLAAAILVARSPSSTIAIMDELRARGPFTRTALSVTVIKDVVVIVLFAVSASIAAALVTPEELDLGFLGLLVLDLILAAAFGVALWKVLEFILGSDLSRIWKIGAILLCGVLIFQLASLMREMSNEFLGVSLHIEPLLVCMLAGFLVTNYGPHRAQFSRLLHSASTPVYVAFFTLAGAALALDVLLTAWGVALALFAVRLLAVFLGSFGGGVLAGDPPERNRISWMAYVTQAGVSLGLAKEVAVEFPPWGEELATILIAVIVINQLIGPPLFKWAIRKVGEDHERGEPHHFDGENDAVIFGVEPQSVALAHQLESHGWQVRMADLEGQGLDQYENTNLDIRRVKDVDKETLDALGLDRAEAVVCLLDEEISYRVCELAYEEYGTPTIVVRVTDRSQIERFRELGALIVDPSVAIVSLFDHFVRSPAGASLLMGMHGDQDVVDIEMQNPDLDGTRLKDLRLPGDTLVLSIRRDGEAIVGHGYTRLRAGDWVTLVGSESSLDHVALDFGPD